MISCIAFQTQHLHWSEWHWYHSRIWWIPAKFKMVICTSVHMKIYRLKSLKSEPAETEETARVCYSSSKTDKNLGNRACKQIANAFVTVDTSLWPVTLWYFLANFVVFVYKESVFHIFFLNMTYMQHMSCLPWTAGPWTLSPPHRALLCSPAELAKATIKPKPQAKVNSPCWWHLGWWPCQRWRRGKL